jgi:hypothetical protein
MRVGNILHGTGGFGCSFAASRPRLGRSVAIKQQSVATFCCLASDRFYVQSLRNFHFTTRIESVTSSVPPQLADSPGRPRGRERLLQRKVVRRALAKLLLSASARSGKGFVFEFDPTNGRVR